jgi:bifunctional non-homologous end joining protein LigD
MLRDLLRDSSAPVRLSEHLEANGPDMFAKVCEMRLKGFISRRCDFPNDQPRDYSLKTKCIKSDSYPIIAFVEKLGAKPRRIASF